jgi:hypothetical protein
MRCERSGTGRAQAWRKVYVSGIIMTAVGQSDAVYSLTRHKLDHSSSLVARGLFATTTYDQRYRYVLLAIASLHRAGRAAWPVPIRDGVRRIRGGQS